MKKKAFVLSQLHSDIQVTALTCCHSTWCKWINPFGEVLALNEAHQWNWTKCSSPDPKKKSMVKRQEWCSWNMWMDWQMTNCIWWTHNQLDDQVDNWPDKQLSDCLSEQIAEDQNGVLLVKNQGPTKPGWEPAQPTGSSFQMMTKNKTLVHFCNAVVLFVLQQQFLFLNIVMLCFDDQWMCSTSVDNWQVCHTDTLSAAFQLVHHVPLQCVTVSDGPRETRSYPLWSFLVNNWNNLWAEVVSNVRWWRNNQIIRTSFKRHTILSFKTVLSCNTQNTNAFVNVINRLQHAFLAQFLQLTQKDFQGSLFLLCGWEAKFTDLGGSMLQSLDSWHSELAISLHWGLSLDLEISFSGCKEWQTLHAVIKIGRFFLQMKT